MDHTATEPSANTSTAVAAAKESLNARRGFSARDCARCHTETKLGAAASSATRASLNSARIFLSSPIISITHFHSCQRLAQLLFAAFIMLTRAADGNAHHIRSFAQTQIFVKDQVQRLALSLRQ